MYILHSTFYIIPHKAVPQETSTEELVTVVQPTVDTEYGCVAFNGQ